MDEVCAPCRQESEATDSCSLFLGLECAWVLPTAISLFCWFQLVLRGVQEPGLPSLSMEPCSLRLVLICQHLWLVLRRWLRNIC